MPEDRQLEMEKVGEVECHAEAETPPRVRWVKLGVGGRVPLPAHVHQQGNKLVFNTARREDAGYYTCVATHPRQGVINATIYIHIVGKHCPLLEFRSSRSFTIRCLFVDAANNYTRIEASPTIFLQQTESVVCVIAYFSTILFTRNE